MQTPHDEPAAGATAAHYDTEVADGIVRERSGQVLGSLMVLKSDLFLGIYETRLAPRVRGAPNYRKISKLPVFGVGQPTLSAMQAVIKLATGGASKRVVWVNLREEAVIYLNGRPYVLREADKMSRNRAPLNGINAERVEEMENRLKNDVLNEARHFGGLLLVHEEMSTILGNVDTVPTWEQIDDENVMTMREVTQKLASQGYDIEYHRLPMHPDVAPNTSQFDALCQVLDGLGSDRPIIFSCQTGSGRSTFASCVATLYLTSLSEPLLATPVGGASFPSFFSPAVHYASRDAPLDEDKCSRMPIILTLVRTLMNGQEAKKNSDQAIERCAQLSNIKSDLLKYAGARPHELSQGTFSVALNKLVKYLSLIVFADFCLYRKTKPDASPSQYMAAHKEIDTLYAKTANNPTQAFSVLPERQGLEVDVIRRRGVILAPDTVLVRHVSKLANLSPKPQLAADVADLVARGDACLLLPQHKGVTALPLTPKGTSSADIAAMRPLLVHGTACTSVENLRMLLLSLGAHPKTAHADEPLLGHVTVAWLRAEPHVFINETPYSLRSVDTPLIENTDILGMTAARLEYLEDELAREVRNEALDGDDGCVRVREVVDEKNTRIDDLLVKAVATPKSVLGALKNDGFDIDFVRVPLSAMMTVPAHFDEIIAVIVKALKTNSQLLFVSSQGFGRISMAMTCALLLGAQLPADVSHRRPSPYRVRAVDELVRVLPHGLKSREHVESVLEMCTDSNRWPLLTYMFKSRVAMEEATDAEMKAYYLARASAALELYCHLIIFEEYLTDQWNRSNRIPVFSMTFVEWVKARPEIELALSGIGKGGVFHPADSMLHNSESAIDKTDHAAVIKARAGTVLLSGSILKSDHFPGCHKEFLPLRLEGAPNYRQERDTKVPIFGVANPTVAGIHTVLGRVRDAIRASDAASEGGEGEGEGEKPSRRIIWTSMREEPVVFVNGAPYVLRNADKPFRNFSYTGITAKRVEAMEERLKEDILAEVAQFGGEVLLHGEEGSGNLLHAHDLKIVSHFVKVSPDAVQTPREVYSALVQDGQDISFYRVPITDEKAAENQAFDQLSEIFFGAMQSQPPPVFIFNCQMGQGRTTSAMVICDLLYHARRNISQATETPPPARALDPSRVTNITLAVKVAKETLPDRLSRGEYACIGALTKLVGGQRVKQQLDDAIDRCNLIQNLRSVVYETHALAETHPHYYGKAVDFLERYFVLLCFNAYLLETWPRDGSLPRSLAKSFSQWVEARPELEHLRETVVLDRLK